MPVFVQRMENGPLKPVSVQTNSVQMHLKAADNVGAAVLSHMVHSAQIHLTAVIFK